MKKFLPLIAMLFTQWLAAASIDGYWKTIDDVTGKPKGIVQIATTDGVTNGTILKGFVVNGVAPKEVCTGCASPFTDKKIIGLQFLYGFHEEDGKWVGGHILDPKGGSIYHATLTPSADGQSLKVRGYIGIPLIGRTQTWQRIDEATFKQLMTQSSAS